MSSAPQPGPSAIPAELEPNEPPQMPSAPPPTENPILARAKMSASEYGRSPFFGEDHPHRRWIVFGALAILGVFIKFALPPSDAHLEVHSFQDLIAFIAAYGAVIIFLMAFLAIYYANAALEELGVNQAIAQWVESSAQKKLEAIRQDPRVRGEVSKLESEHLPDNPSNPKPAALRLFQRICREAADRRFESTINLIEPYQRESMEPVFRLEGVQKNALRGGILCHFIGLVIVINAVPGILSRPAPTGLPAAPQVIAPEGAPAEPQTSTIAAIGPILDGLRLAFGASVGGLAVSLFAAILLSEVRKKQFQYFRKLDEATSTMLSLASNSLNNDELLSSLSSMSKKLEAQTEVVRLGIGQVAAAISVQSETIAKGLGALTEGKTKLDGFLKGVSDSHEEFLKRLNTYYDVGTMGTLVDGAEKRISRAIQDSGSALASSAGQTATSVGKVQSELSNMRGILHEVNETANMRLGGSIFKVLPWLILALTGASVVNLILYWVR